MPISAKTILHFTKNVDSLRKILSGNFNVHYCKEFFYLNGANYRLGIPMVSFCDIPLSQISEHTEKYGNYGIGLSKAWARSKRINPVLYMEEKSLIAVMIEPFLRDVIENDKFGGIRAEFKTKHLENGGMHIEPINDPERRLKIDSAVGQLSFIKNYSEPRGENIYINYDEREWRYVPTNYDHSESDIYFHPILTEGEYNDRRDNMSNKPALKDRFLSFKSNDVSYIFVAQESEISPLIQHLRRQKEKCYNSKDELDVLISRIFSLERLRYDI